MFWSRRYHLAIAVGVGMVGGLILSGLWPHSPLYAVATDRADTFAMATGHLDSEVEAVYFLDFLTGDLTALVLGKAPGQWTGFFRTNVSSDLAVDPQRNPKFMMTTGLVPLRRGGGSRLQPSSAMCYIAEVTSGKVAAYVVPWSPSQYASGQLQNEALRCVGVFNFRQMTSESPLPNAGEAKPQSGSRKTRQR